MRRVRRRPGRKTGQRFREPQVRTSTAGAGEDGERASAVDLQLTVTVKLAELVTEPEAPVMVRV